MSDELKTPGKPMSRHDKVVVAGLVLFVLFLVVAAYASLLHSHPHTFPF